MQSDERPAHGQRILHGNLQTRLCVESMYIYGTKNNVYLRLKNSENYQHVSSLSAILFRFETTTCKKQCTNTIDTKHCIKANNKS